MGAEPSGLDIDDETKAAKDRRSVIMTVMVYCLLTVLMMVIFFVSAGRLDMPRAWFYFALSTIHWLSGTIVIYKFSPRLLNQRTKVKREGSKLWDEVLMRVTNLTAMFIVPAVAALDVGRFQWSSLDVEFVAAGVVLAIAGAVLVDWAMVTNPFFEPTVRIQKERGHRVITTGPYVFVRHPGYLSGILWILSAPLIIGSLAAFIPSGAYVLLITARAWLEDKTLLEELPGYREYAEKVRYRLFPLIW